MTTQLLLAGFCGGAIRGLVGFVKYQYSYKNVPFKVGYFLMMVFISGLIGLSAGWIISGISDLGDASNFYAFLAGYAGGDFMENAFKTVLKKPSIYKMPVK